MPIDVSRAAMSPERDDDGASDPGLNGSMTDIGSSFYEGNTPPGVSLTRAGRDTAQTGGTDPNIWTWVAFRGG